MDMIVFLDIKPEDHENFRMALDKLNLEEKRPMTNAERCKKYRENKKNVSERVDVVSVCDDTKESTKENILINTSDNYQEDLLIPCDDIYSIPEELINSTEELKEKEINKEKEKRNKKSNTSERKKKYGQFRNVLLTDEELQKFQEKFPDTWKSKIEDMSIAIASKGYVYKSHYAALLNWARKNGDYTFESRKGERAFKESQQQKLTPSEIGRMLDEMEQKTEMVVDL